MPALSAPARGAPADAACREEHARCRDDCSLDYGASITHRPRLAACLQKCDRAEEVCREKGLRASKKQEAPSRPRSEPSLGTSRDEPQRASTPAPSPPAPSTPARNVGAPDWLDTPDDPPSPATASPAPPSQPPVRQVERTSPIYDDPRPGREAVPDPIDDLDVAVPDPVPVATPARQVTPPPPRPRDPVPQDELDFGDDLFFAEEQPPSGPASKPVPRERTAPSPAPSSPPTRSSPLPPARPDPSKTPTKPLVEVPEDHSEWNPD